MDSYTFVIIVTLVGFFALAAALLVPVYRFLKKEEKVAEEWLDESASASDHERNGRIKKEESAAVSSQ